jgi:hypothetical protein
MTLPMRSSDHNPAIPPFAEVLGLCNAAGQVEVGVISIGGMKIGADASQGADRTRESPVADILNEAEETDRCGDRPFRLRSPR